MFIVRLQFVFCHICLWISCPRDIFVSRLAREWKPHKLSLKYEFLQKFYASSLSILLSASMLKILVCRLKRKMSVMLMNDFRKVSTGQRSRPRTCNVTRTEFGGNECILAEFCFLSVCEHLRRPRSISKKRSFGPTKIQILKAKAEKM